ncbi:DNA-binding transcriptional regulator, LysR family [Bosea sp. 62]|uniref:LysR substrate-binding domain-containing protein n=1 Tax=unclassified Bosea (in: a-proteobacteria) TaxID=2653178 RepID=UPI0012587973|nr:MULTISPECIES: LysR substrate-binding domain-containing protein [unclassified Bosea (in: a-proteobacteria)]CAD5256608.1 DNA-binding transcriptional regulator, LysR family [Bosea sp. 7B]CAD5273805.1 DNA-binding transcriptional regulator, LysR family [Bosea sp. 21B]CAD5284324.1 DNA-binding transcriptional regulator, LysR family [Bosea sp. 46]VVT60168.1 DNA-binding transcriptional regulator, LysR family [Bosea sp. EC-HK365B]VXB57771.1 DNA-binding transcriptional regulator, LysR family [Bosea sp
MRLRQLECFRALMIHGTMTRVAELLGISQPGVSTMIAALEHDFGVPLFVRRGTRLQPTPEAHLIYAEASRALEAVENTARVASEIRAGKRGHLAITAYPSISIALLPRLLSVFAAERPGLQMKIITRASQSVKELMSTRTFDFAIAELPLDYPTAQMEVFSYQCQCMLPLGHPLAEREEITPADLDGLPFVTLFRGDPVYQKLAAAFSEYGARWNVVAETEFFSSACELVAAGIGVGIVDPVVSGPFTADVVRRPFRPAISYEIAILHPLHEELSQLAREFMVPLREALTA